MVNVLKFSELVCNIDGEFKRIHNPSKLDIGAVFNALNFRAERRFIGYSIEKQAIRRALILDVEDGILRLTYGVFREYEEDNVYTFYPLGFVHPDTSVEFKGEPVGDGSLFRDAKLARDIFFDLHDKGDAANVNFI